VTDPAQPPTDAPEQSGLTLRRRWPVWASRVQHRVDVEVNALTGAATVYVDGQPAARRGIWNMDLNGFELPFDVDGRPCSLVVRTRYGDQMQVDLYSEGRSLSTGEPVEALQEAQGRELPNLVRMLLIFIPAIGLFTVLRQSASAPNSLGWAAPALLIVVALGSATAGWTLASRWYGRGPETPNRHLVGGAIVAAAWVAFFAAFVVITLLGRT
jgi:hypothetical protein